MLLRHQRIEKKERKRVEAKNCETGMGAGEKRGAQSEFERTAGIGGNENIYGRSKD